MTAFTSFDDLAPRWVVKLYDDLGLATFQGAGLLGNLGYESNGFRDLQEKKPMVVGSRGGYGVAMWTGQRRRQYEAWCTKNKLDPASVEANYGFLVEELRTTYKPFCDRLKRTKTLEEACRLAHKEYENPADVADGSYRSGPDRLAYAKRALETPSYAEVDAAARDHLEATMRLQRLLKGRGLYQGPIDGDFGPASRTALQAYLRSK